MKPVEEFNIDCHILHHHMSPVATKHALLAVAGDSGKLASLKLAFIFLLNRLIFYLIVLNLSVYFCHLYISTVVYNNDI